jgi:hypothetical protein
LTVYTIGHSTRTIAEFVALLQQVRVDTDGEIGHVEDFLLDDADWSIPYLVVDTRNWWPGEHILMSPRTVREIEWVDRAIHLTINRQQVKAGPAYDPSKMPDRTNEYLMIKYYRRGA